MKHIKKIIVVVLTFALVICGIQFVGQYSISAVSNNSKNSAKYLAMNKTIKQSLSGKANSYVCWYRLNCLNSYGKVTATVTSSSSHKYEINLVNGSLHKTVASKRVIGSKKVSATLVPKAYGNNTLYLMVSCKSCRGKKDSSCTVTSKVTFTKVVKVSKISIKASSSKVKVGKTIKLVSTVYPSNAANKKVKWSVSNSNYATISTSGILKAKKAGKNKTVTVTCSSTDGSKKKASIKIKIVK